MLTGDDVEELLGPHLPALREFDMVGGFHEDCVAVCAKQLLRASQWGWHCFGAACLDGRLTVLKGKSSSSLTRLPPPHGRRSTLLQACTLAEPGSLEKLAERRPQLSVGTSLVNSQSLASRIRRLAAGGWL